MPLGYGGHFYIFCVVEILFTKVLPKPLPQ